MAALLYRASLFTTLFLFLATPTIASDEREMSIDEYINYVNPPALHKYQNEFGDTILCVKFEDQISVKYGPDTNLTRVPDELPRKLEPAGKNISNITKSSVKPMCPDDLVPIMEIKREEVEKAGSVRQFLDRRRISRKASDTAEHEYGVVHFRSPSTAIGEASAHLSVWNPAVEDDDYFSLSQLWVIQDRDRVGLETLEVGWMVFPGRFNGDKQTRLFTYWTPDNYNTGCYDETCPGFVGSNAAPYAPGSPLPRLSAIAGEQNEIALKIVRQVTNNQGIVWTLYVDDYMVGYWPGNLFTSLTTTGATLVDFGGEVALLRKGVGTPFSKTEMGSGRFSQEGKGYAAYTRDMQIYAYNDGSILDLQGQTQVSRPNCYTVDYFEDNSNALWAKYIYFGGPAANMNPSCIY